MMDRPLLVKILLALAVACFAVALCVTAGWVDAAGNARDCWLVGGFLALASAWLVERL